MNKVLILSLLLSCFSFNIVAKETTDLALNGFKQVIKNVHYLAKLRITNVEISHEDDDSEKQVYSAEVLATYKGDVHKQIHYEMFVEQGENVVFNSAPMYIALCIDNKGTFYWPGTGSAFKYSSAIDTWLTENKNNLETKGSTADWCQ